MDIFRILKRGAKPGWDPTRVGTWVDAVDFERTVRTLSDEQRQVPIAVIQRLKDGLAETLAGPATLSEKDLMTIRGAMQGLGDAQRALLQTYEHADNCDAASAAAEEA